MINYVQAWSENSFGRYFFNSMDVALGTVLITVVFASLAAFAFARYQFPLQGVHLLPPSSPPWRFRVSSSSFLSTSWSLKLHLTDSLLRAVLIYASENLPFSIFLLRGFFEAVPEGT